MVSLGKCKQLAYRGRKHVKPKAGYDGPEAELRAQAEDLLAQLQVEYRTIPDVVWAAVAQSPAGRALGKTWKDKPDLLLLIPVEGKPYYVAAQIELKNRDGKLTPRQVKYAARSPVDVCRTVEDVLGVLRGLQTVAERKR